MADLRLADEVLKATEYVSTREETDVELTLADGSRLLYVKGEDVTPVWWAAPMQVMVPGEPPSDLDMTPEKVGLGRWRDEAEQFISTRSLSIPEFLELYKLAAARR